VRNEEDMIRETLTAAAGWCDAVYVLDNGSDDRTWEIVQAVAAELPAVVPHGRDDRPFSDALRGDLFGARRGEGAVGDWWGILDADELYIDDPRQFLAEVPQRYEQVWSACFEYHFTDLDAQRYEQNPSLYDDSVPAEVKLRYYLNTWSDRRFFRQTRRLVWRDGDWPENLGAVYPRRIRYKHFQYRSPQQIQKRIDARRAAVEDGRFLHEALPNWAEAAVDTSRADFAQAGTAYVPTSWRERVIDHRLLLEDTGDGIYVVDEGRLPPIPRAWPTWARRLRRAVRRLGSRRG
jgi:glycosyltransferase involved in cell wall biosynthesis